MVDFALGTPNHSIFDEYNDNIGNHLFRSPMSSLMTIVMTN